MQKRCSVTQKWKFVVLSYHPGCEQALSMNGPNENSVDFKGLKLVKGSNYAQNTYMHIKHLKGAAL